MTQPFIARVLRNRDLLMVLVLAGLVAAIGGVRGSFLAPANLAAVFNDSAILIILALGQMAVITSRCIDLSVAAYLALSGMIVALMNAASPDLPIGLLIATAALCGLGLGAINGLLVWLVGIPPIVVTLGTMAIYRGLIFLISDGQWVNSHEMSDGFLELPRQVFAGLPVLGWIGIALIAGMALFIRHTRLGRAFYAAGGNPVAAVYAGINVGRTRFFAFCVSGLLAGICGYLWVSRYAVAYVDLAPGFELDVVAACVIGGISIAGGIGTVGGAVLGALFLGVVKNALPVIGVSPFWQLAISGSVIILAVAINARQSRRRGRLILRESHALP